MMEADQTRQRGHLRKEDLVRLCKVECEEFKSYIQLAWLHAVTMSTLMMANYVHISCLSMWCV